MEDLNSLSTENSIYFKKYIIPDQILLYNPDNVINKENIDNYICPICFLILKEPKSCSNQKNSHSFCKECIDNYLKENNKCPTCKRIFEYRINNQIKNELNKLSFRCTFKNEGCNEIILYSDYINHLNKCKYNNIKYKCQIMEYNYKRKEFEICGYTGDKIKITKHFKICAFNKFKCLFCNENLLRMNLEDHVKNKCNFGFIKYPNGSKYFGQKHLNLREGFGIIYYSNGHIYKGEFKNGLREGYGIEYYPDGGRYEGEFKNNIVEGYGTLYNSNGDKYEGQFKNYQSDGNGIYYFLNGNIYEGEFKNGKNEDVFGIVYYKNGDKFEGEFKQGNNRAGIFYSKFGFKYGENFNEGFFNKVFYYL